MSNENRIGCPIISGLGVQCTPDYALAGAVEVNATLIASGSVVSDTATNMEWLKVTDTYGVLYEQLLTDLSPGNKYAGWHIASAAQVLTLIGDAGLPNAIAGFKDTTGQYTSAMSTFQNLMGAFSTDDPWYRYTQGIVSDSPTSVPPVF